MQTTRHFNLLSETAAVGGAGNQSLDAHVKEIDEQYHVSMAAFSRSVRDVMCIDETQAFERAFFKFRAIVKVKSAIIIGLWFN